MLRALLPIVVLALALPHATQAQEACEPQRLASPPDTPAWKYGASVQTNGRFWFVGDSSARTGCGGDPLACSTGAVFVYEFDGEQWTEAARIEAPAEVSTGFGTNVILHGDALIVWPNLGPDHVFSYRLVGDQWTLVETVRPHPDARNWGFGFAMHLDDQWLFVGAPYDDTITPSGGSVYAYTREPDGTFEFVQRLEADFLGRHGQGVAYNGRSLLVGVPGYSP